MKIGIIVCSYTGNTLSVAEKLRSVLQSNGSEVMIERIKPESDKPGSAKVKIVSAPDVLPYDGLIFASPVQGFQLAPLMKLYVDGISDISGKKTCVFLTQHLKKAFFGGNKAIKQLTAGIAKKGGSVAYRGIIHWSSPEREKQINDLITGITAALKE